ncbi:MAG: hypothetical protein IH946_09695 [Bacteroidetes bacterium]|nr:hypothetical protein [Bacteroidota bacterium]
MRTFLKCTLTLLIMIMSASTSHVKAQSGFKLDSIRHLGILIDITGAGVVVKVITGGPSRFMFLEGSGFVKGQVVGLEPIGVVSITKRTWKGSGEPIPTYMGSVISLDKNEIGKVMKRVMPGDNGTICVKCTHGK